MKTLYDRYGVVLAVMADGNYVVYLESSKRVSKGSDGRESVTYKYGYFSEINHAVKEVARLTANDKAADLGEWLEVYTTHLQLVLSMMDEAVGKIKKAVAK